MIQREDISRTLTATSSDRPSTVLETDLRMRLKAFPRDAQTWFRLGSYLHSIGRLNEAEDALRKAITINPNPAHFHEELGLILIALGRLDEAYRSLDRRSGPPRDAIREEIESARTIDRGVNEAMDVISPCVECSDYTYYGCSKGGNCDLILQWRARIREIQAQTIQK